MTHEDLAEMAIGKELVEWEEDMMAEIEGTVYFEEETNLPFCGDMIRVHVCNEEDTYHGIFDIDIDDDRIIIFCE